MYLFAVIILSVYFPDTLCFIGYFWTSSHCYFIISIYMLHNKKTSKEGVR
jgi:hypothetical protein